jgi:large subunit ribosomal protein L10
MPNPQKVKQVENLVSKLEGVDNIYLTDFRGLNVAEMSELRASLRDARIDYFIVKNTLTRIASEKLGISEINDFLEGSTAIAIGREDPLAPAKVISEFNKKREKPKFKKALIEGRIYDSQEILTLSKIPPIEMLYGKLLGSIQMPLYSFVSFCSTPMRNLACVLRAIAQKKEEQGE